VPNGSTDRRQRSGGGLRRVAESMTRHLSKRSGSKWNARKPTLRKLVNAAAKSSQETPRRDAASSAGSSAPVGNSEVLPPPGKRGAAAALARLEQQEEEAHRRLLLALGRSNPVEIDAAQTFWLKCSEVLRRLDLAIELSRRSEEEQIPLRKAQDAVLFVAEWLRISVTTFLSSETISLMGIKDPGEFRAYFGQRYKGILDLTVKNADKTCSAVPDWAKATIKTAWNVQ
jgi:hypothetical protein